LQKILNIQNLDFGYVSDRLIYKNFSLSLNVGEIISIVGPSGSGKSTLFELISNNLSPLKGTIEASKMSSIYQDPYTSFHPSFTILNQIKDISPNLNKIDYFLEKLSLEKKFLNKKPHELSGGQLQRFSILRSLLMGPKLLLVDEPTSALDNIIARDVMQLLLKFLPDYGILLITHDVHLATWCSDKIIHLNEGNTNE